MKQEKARKGMLAKFAAVLTAFVLAMSFLPISVLGTQSAWADIASGTSGTCSWVISDAGVLTISPTNGNSGTLANYDPESEFPYSWSQNNSSITAIVIEPGVSANTSMQDMFQGCTQLESISGLSNLNTSAVTSMGNMFKC